MLGDGRDLAQGAGGGPRIKASTVDHAGDGLASDRLGAGAGQRSEVRATTRQGRSEFIGRERERGLLAARIGAALTGEGQVVLLAAEPGIGKTRMAEEVAGIAAARSMPCRWGRATDEE